MYYSEINGAMILLDLTDGLFEIIVCRLHWAIIQTNINIFGKFASFMSTISCLVEYLYI